MGLGQLLSAPIGIDFTSNTLLPLPSELIRKNVCWKEGDGFN